MYTFEKAEKKLGVNFSQSQINRFKRLPNGSFLKTNFSDILISILSLLTLYFNFPLMIIFYKSCLWMAMSLFVIGTYSFRKYAKRLPSQYRPELTKYDLLNTVNVLSLCSSAIVVATCMVLNLPLLAGCFFTLSTYRVIFKSSKYYRDFLIEMLDTSPE